MSKEFHPSDGFDDVSSVAKQSQRSNNDSLYSLAMLNKTDM
jgi:hypothetical protein